MTNPHGVTGTVADRAGHLFGLPRFAGYVNHCGGNHRDALDLYQWNVEASGAMWETIGHVEVALRNRLAHQERIWNLRIRAVHRDALIVARFIDQDLSLWVRHRSRVQRLLSQCPQPRPHL